MNVPRLYLTHLYLLDQTEWGVSCSWSYKDMHTNHLSIAAITDTI